MPKNKQLVKMTEQEIDENIIESFPASDPPGWTSGLDPDKPKRSKDATNIPPK